MLRILPVLLLLAILPASACKWDRDTIREESKGKLDTVRAITGWFDRYPAGYYEMRLARVSEELKADPSRLDLYDDAGVACDNLGRYDDAIAWMAKKKAVLNALPAQETSTHRYRYLANLGSFLGNRWATKPAVQRNADRTDLAEATRLIHEAITLNPDAHFGREVYQLLLFDWILRGYGPEKNDRSSFIGWSSTPSPHLKVTGEESPERQEAGLVGLIHLGSAWESIDVFSALAYVLLEEDHTNLSYLAELRVAELKVGGAESLHPQGGMGDTGFGQMVVTKDNAEKWFKQARAASIQRMNAWTAYQEGRFARGMHPDTHPDFWSDWKEPQLPRMPGQSFMQWAGTEDGKSVIILLMFSIIGGSLIGAFYLSYRRFMSARAKASGRRAAAR